jgi:hypothetical protein
MAGGSGPNAVHLGSNRGRSNATAGNLTGPKHSMKTHPSANLKNMPRNQQKTVDSEKDEKEQKKEPPKEPIFLPSTGIDLPYLKRRPVFIRNAPELEMVHSGASSSLKLLPVNPSLQLNARPDYH